MAVQIQFGNSVLTDNSEVPGTGQTVAELLSIGYTTDDITAMLENAAASGLIQAPGYEAPTTYGPMPVRQPTVAINLPSVQSTSVAAPAGLLPGPAPRVTVPSAASSVTSFFTGSSLISGLPNWAVLGIGLIGAPILLNMVTGASGGRRRR